MLPFHTQLLRAHFAQTHWDEDAFFSSLTRPTAAVLDFRTPENFEFGFARSPSASFHKVITGSLLPVLSGEASYLAVCPPLHAPSSSASPSSSTLYGQTELFHLPHPPRRPHVDEVWLGGRRVDKTPFLTWGRVSLPEWKVEGVGSRRMSDRVMGLMAFVHTPAEKGKSKGKDGLVLQVQHSNGRWGGEYSYSVTDGLFGIRTLCSLASPGLEQVDVQQGDADEREGSLKGRFSVGMESYLSLKQKSAGLSLATRYLTPASPNPQVPASISTLLFSPLIGHISTSYLSRLSPSLALGTRYEFNVYSYESDWTVGGEWKVGTVSKEEGSEEEKGVLKARCSTTGDVSVMYLGQVGHVAYELGVRADLSHRANPIKGLGLELRFNS